MKKLIALCLVLILLSTVQQVILAVDNCPSCKYISESTRQTTSNTKTKKCFFCQHKLNISPNEYCRLFSQSATYDFHYGCFEQFSSLFREITQTCEECKEAIKSTLTTIPANYKSSLKKQTTEDVDTETSFDQVPIGRCWACAILCCPCLICTFFKNGYGCQDCPTAYGEACTIACCHLPKE